ncbi:hypothetical protein CBL_08904 [Carabus blaptoides fortunei]
MAYIHVYSHIQALVIKAITPAEEVHHETSSSSTDEKFRVGLLDWEEWASSRFKRYGESLINILTIRVYHARYEHKAQGNGDVTCLSPLGPYYYLLKAFPIAHILSQPWLIKDSDLQSSILKLYCSLCTSSTYATCHGTDWN